MVEDGAFRFIFKLGGADMVLNRAIFSALAFATVVTVQGGPAMAQLSLSYSAESVYNPNLCAGTCPATDASVWGRITECGEPSIGYGIRAFTEERIGVWVESDGSPGRCRYQTRRTLIGYGRTDSGGRYRINYRRPERPPWTCGYSSRVYVQAQAPGASAYSWTSAKKAASSSVAIDTRECPLGDALDTPLGSGPYDYGVRQVNRMPLSAEAIQFPEGGVEGAGDRRTYYEPSTGFALIYYPATASGAVASGGPFPVIVYGHGQRWYGLGTPADNSKDYKQLGGILAYLAKKGFIVISVDLSWQTPNPVSTPSRTSADYFNRMQVMKDALNYMQEENCLPWSPFFGRADTSRAGALGHSMGSAGAIMLGAEDIRVLAVALMGPNLHKLEQFTAAKSFAPRPLMTIHGSADFFSRWNTYQSIYCNALPNKYLVRIADGNHFGFTNALNLDSTMADSPMGPSMTRTAQRRLTRGYLAAFFRRTLLCDRGMDTVLQSQTSWAGATVTDYALEGSSTGRTTTSCGPGGGAGSSGDTGGSGPVCLPANPTCPVRWPTDMSRSF